MTKEFAALIFIGLLVLAVLVYAVFSARERSGAVEARLAAMSGLGGANRLEKNAQLTAFLRQPECQATIHRDDGSASAGMVSQAEHRCRSASARHGWRCLLDHRSQMAS